MTSDSYPVRRRLVGAALRACREALGFEMDDVAQILGCDRSKVSRIETGQRGIRSGELREILTEYGAGAAVQGALQALAAPDIWQRDYATAIGEVHAELLALQMAASQILSYSQHAVPDLLQTPEYTTSILRAGNRLPDADSAGSRTRLAETRQEALLSERRPALTAVIDEAVLYRTVAGPDVMRTQLRWLACACEGRVRDVSVQVLPFGCNAPILMWGSATVLRFLDSPVIGVVHVPTLSDKGTYLVSQDDVKSYVAAFRSLKKAALTSADSAQLLRKLADG